MPACQQCRKPESELGGNKKLSRCSRCGAAAYCSRECQVAAWPAHKETCGKSAPTISASSMGQTRSDPFLDFKPFIESISEEVAAVLQIPYFDHLYGPHSDRASVLFHLHFKHTATSAEGPIRNRFKLEDPVAQVTPAQFLEWVRSSVPGSAPVLPQYERMFAEIEATDKLRRAQTSAASRKDAPAPPADTEEQTIASPATIRLVCTAANETGRFLGLRTSVLNIQTRTRSGLDPRNRGLAFDTPLRAIINEPIVNIVPVSTDEPESVAQNARAVALLKRVVREYSRNDDAWLQRAHDSQPINDADPWDDVGLASRAIQLGIDEKIMLGGRDRKALIYAIAAPEIRTRCPCGEYHGIEGHVDEDESEGDEDDGMDEDDARAASESHRQHLHSHSHDGQSTCAHSHSH